MLIIDILQENISNLFEIKKNNDCAVKSLELIVDEITKRNEETIKTHVITGYSTTYNIVSDFFDNDSPQLRRIIESKIFPLAKLTISSQYIEIDEKLKLLRSLLYVHFVDKKYDYEIREILNSLNLESEESMFNFNYCLEHLVLYTDLFKYLFNEITLSELLNIYLLKIIENSNLFSEIRFLLEYLYSKISFNEGILNSVFIIINIMLNSKDEENRVCAIKLSKVLYQKLIFVTNHLKYNEVKAVIILIKNLNDNKNELIQQLIYNIIHSQNYNIRYMGKKYLINLDSN